MHLQGIYGGKAPHALVKQEWLSFIIKRLENSVDTGFTGPERVRLMLTNKGFMI